MKRGAIVIALGAVLVTAAWAWAAVCPLCLQQIPEGEKYCERHKAEMLARRIASTDESRLVEELQTSRDAYQEKLEALEKFYEERGNADGLRKVRDELLDFRRARQYTDSNWEEGLTDLNAVENIPEANELLEAADDLRKGINPFSRARRYPAAAAKYQEILLKYPTSTVVDDAAYGMGEIYSSGSVGEYRRAMRFYELAYIADPATQQGALISAAEVADDDLGDYEEAARFYWLASRMGDSLVDRKMAAMRLNDLQKKGFGTKYVAETPVEVAGEDDGEAK